MKDTNQGKTKPSKQHNFSNKNLVSNDNSGSISDNIRVIPKTRNYTKFFARFFIILFAVLLVFLTGWKIGSRKADTRCEINCTQKIPEQPDPNERFKETVFNSQVHLYTVIDQRTEKKIVWLDEDVPIQLFSYEFTYNLEDFLSSPNRDQIIARVKSPLHQQYYLIDLLNRQSSLLELGQNEKVVGWLGEGALLLDKVKNPDLLGPEAHEYYVFSISSMDRNKVSDIKDVLVENLDSKFDGVKNTEGLIQKCPQYIVSEEYATVSVDDAESEESESRAYYIIDDEEISFNEVDQDWITENCDSIPEKTES